MVCRRIVIPLLGVPIGRQYIQRIGLLRAVNGFRPYWSFRSGVGFLMKGNRDDQYAIVLTGNYRLIIAKMQADRVRSIEVEDHYGN
jgi:hypothetical protein